MSAQGRLVLPRPVLLVGAGGTGSEVAHALLHACEGAVTVVDADRVETTNLGRQAFFGEADVGAHKAEALARELSARSEGRIAAAARTEDIRSGAYTPAFYRGFLCVVSCVDNAEARERINKMCVIAGVQSIETGSSGYLGQVYRIAPGETECFACRGPETERVFPVCTIRGAPTAWEHCVHWAAQEFLPRLKERAGGRPLGGAELARAHAGKMCTDGLEELLARAPACGAGSPALVHGLALLRAKKHGVAPQPETRTLDILDKTVPSVITTNSVLGAIAVLELAKIAERAGKAPREQGVGGARAYYLAQGAQIRSVPAQGPNSLCAVCACTPCTLTVRRTDTLGDVLAALDVRAERAAVTTDSGGLLYDAEFAENLGLPLAELQLRTGAIVSVRTEREKHLVYLVVL